MALEATFGAGPTGMCGAPGGTWTPGAAGPAPPATPARPRARIMSEPMTPSRSNPATAIPPTRRSQPKKPRPPPPAIVRQRERAHSSPPAQVLPPHSTFLILTSFELSSRKLTATRLLIRSSAGRNQVRTTCWLISETSVSICGANPSRLRTQRKVPPDRFDSSPSPISGRRLSTGL